MSLEQLLLSDKNLKEWDEYFTSLRRDEFHNILRETIRAHSSVPLTLLIALARKLYEDAHFSDGLEENDRSIWSDFAEDMMQHAINSTTEQDRDDLLKAWQATKDYAARFGYSSKAIYETLAPHRIFADT